MNRSTKVISPPPGEAAVLGGGNEHWRIQLVNVPSGVAAGRTAHSHGNTHTESWALFVTREQFDACVETDPLRFADPLLFEQIKREFNHVFDQPNSNDPDVFHL